MNPSINGTPVEKLRFEYASSGLWQALASLASDKAIEGPCTVEFGDRTFVGFATGALDLGGRPTVRVLAGSGQFGSTIVEPLGESGTTLGEVVRNILTASGDVLSATSDLETTLIPVDAWTRVRSDGAETLRLLAREYKFAWRFLPNGEVWIGQETWPEATGEFSITNESPTEQTVQVATDTAFVLPGMTFRGEHVASVEYNIEASRARVTVRFGAREAQAELLATLIRREVGPIDFFALYAARVVGQNGDGTLEVVPFDERLSGLSRVPIRHGIPGVEIKVRNGARVLVGFENGSPRQRFAALWGSDGLESLTITATDVTISAEVVRLGDGNARFLREGDVLSISGVQAGFGVVGAIASVTSPLPGPPGVGGTRVLG